MVRNKIFGIRNNQQTADEEINIVYLIVCAEDYQVNLVANKFA